MLLDEPTVGADVQTRSELLGVVRRLAAEGVAVVYSTHYFPEVEVLGATVAILERGHLRARGTLTDVVARYAIGAVDVAFAGPAPDLAQLFPGGAVTTVGTRVRIKTNDPARVVADVLAALGARAGELRELTDLAAEPRGGLPAASLKEPPPTPPANCPMSRRRIGAIVAHQLRLLRRDPVPVMVLVVFPLILMAFLKPTFALALAAHGHPRTNGAEQVVPGEAVVNGFYIVGMTSFAFFAEHGWNTWDRLRASNATSAEIILGKALPLLAVSVTQFLVIFAIGVPLFDLHSRGPLLALVPLVSAFATCLVMIGVAVTAACRTLQQANAFAFGGIVLFGALGGALVPIDTLPQLGEDRRPSHTHLLGHARLPISHPRRPRLHCHPRSDRSARRHVRRPRHRFAQPVPLHRRKDLLLTASPFAAADRPWPRGTASRPGHSCRCCSDDLDVTGHLLDGLPHGHGPAQEVDADEAQSDASTPTQPSHPGEQRTPMTGTTRGPRRCSQR